MQKNQLSLPLQYAFVAHDRFSFQLAYALRRVPCCAANASRVTKKKTMANQNSQNQLRTIAEKINIYRHFLSWFVGLSFSIAVDCSRSATVNCWKFNYTQGKICNRAFKHEIACSTFSVSHKNDGDGSAYLSRSSGSYFQLKKKQNKTKAHSISYLNIKRVRMRTRVSHQTDIAH